MLRLLVTTLLIVVLYTNRERLPIPLFRLPGDVVINVNGAKVHVPFTTCLLVSIAVSLIGALSGGR